jgi:hypothetical protein
MRETALMDILQDGGVASPADQWAPSAEKVLGPAQLTGGDLTAAAPDTGLPAPRPAGFGPPRDTGPGSNRASGRPVLSAADLDALEDLTFAELAQARGLDAAALPRLGALKRPRCDGPPPGAAPGPTPVTPRPDTPRPVTRRPVAARPVAARPVAPRSILPTDALPTWPPPGLVAAWSTAPTSKDLGPLRGRHRGYLQRRSGWARLMAAALAFAGAGVAVWILVLRPPNPSPPSGWDPRVAPIASFVQHQRGLIWKHSLRVSFVSSQAYADRFGVAYPSSPGGSNVAHYDSSDDQVYVTGTPIDLYQLFGLAGQLTEALDGQYGGSAPTSAGYVEAAKIQAAWVRTLPASAVQALESQARAGS